jgi:hypothetical protein
MIFVWTFEGVLQAIALGIVLFFFGLLGLAILWDKIAERFKPKKEQPK